jgi:hypothetical protein
MSRAFEKFGCVEKVELAGPEVYLVGEVLQLCPPDFAEWTWFIFSPLVENS